MSDHNTKLIHFDKLEVHCSIYPQYADKLCITIFLPNGGKNNPYAEKVLKFIETLLKNEGLNSGLATEPTTEAEHHGVMYTRNVYRFSGYSSGRMQQLVCDALGDASVVFNLHWGTRSEFSGDEAKMDMFEKSLKGAMPLPRAVPHKSFEQALWEGINGTIRDFNNASKELAIDETAVSKQLVALATGNPHCTPSEIQDTIRTTDGITEGFTDPLNSLTANLAKIIRNVQKLRVEEMVLKGLDKFNDTSGTKFSKGETEKVATAVAALPVRDEQHIAGILHQYDAGGECKGIIDTYLAGELANIIADALKPQRSYSR